MFVNFENSTIELTTAEMNEAKKYGSEMYNSVMAARRDNPGYRVVEIKAKKTKSPTDGIGLKDIKAFVKAHGTEEQKKEFLRLTTPTFTEEGLYMPAASFFTVKKWFLAQFPQVLAAFKSRAEEIQAINDAIDDKIANAKKAKLTATLAKAKAEADEFLAA